MTTETGLATVFDPTQQTSLIASSDDNYLNPARFDQIHRLAKVFAASDLVPAHFKGKTENCFIALQMAFRSKIDPMIALQNLYVVSGKPGMSAQLAIALANTSKLLRGPIHFTEIGTKGAADFAVTAEADTVDGGRKISTTVSMAMAKAEGWTKNPKYATMPDVMLRYRAATFLIRQHFPQVLLGLHTDDELRDVDFAQRPTIDVTPAAPAKPRRSRAEAVAEKLAKPEMPAFEEREFADSDIPFEPTGDPAADDSQEPVPDGEAQHASPAAAVPILNGNAKSMVDEIDGALRRADCSKEIRAALIDLRARKNVMSLSRGEFGVSYNAALKGNIGMLLDLIDRASK